MKFFNVTGSSVYGIHNPIGLKYLTRLRVGLSHLRKHKLDHNFRDNITCNCNCNKNRPEDLEHFLLYCPTYHVFRSELFESLRMIISLLVLTSPSYICNLLLYGDRIYDIQTNRKILETIIKYLISRQRFDKNLILGDWKTKKEK